MLSVPHATGRRFGDFLADVVLNRHISTQGFCGLYLR